MERMTLKEARTKQAALKVEGVNATVMIDPALGWGKRSYDDRLNPDHPRHHELCTEYGQNYLVVE